MRGYEGEDRVFFASTGLEGVDEGGDRARVGVDRDPRVVHGQRAAAEEPEDLVGQVAVKVVHGDFVVIIASGEELGEDQGMRGAGLALLEGRVEEGRRHRVDVGDVPKDCLEEAEVGAAGAVVVIWNVSGEQDQIFTSGVVA